MALTFSDEMMKSMGFRLFAAGETVRARFVHLTVFAIEGISVASTEISTVTVKGHVCKLAISPKVNSACQALLSDDYSGDESEWEKVHKCIGPYALVVVGPTEEFEANTGQIKEEADGSFTTYDCFPTAKTYLREVASEVLPELLTALTCNLFTPGHHFRVRSVDVTTCGTTPQGRTVHDVRITMSAHAIVSIAATAEMVQASLVGVGSQLPKLNAKVARFFKLAMFEEDDLKRFLYFFLAIEVKTHATFAAVDHSGSIGSLVPTASPAGQSVAALLKRHTDNMKNLRDRFVWCSLCVWTSITDDDVTEFKRLESPRN